MIKELTSIESNRTWQLIKLLANTKAIEVKWVYKLKHNLDSSITKHKVGLVERGFLQRASIDYSVVYAPVTRLEKSRL